MIAYLILAHRYPDQFKRLFKAIYHPDNYYLIHVDKRSETEIHQEIQDFLVNYPNAGVLESENALWGGYSLVDAELRGIEKLLKMSQSWEFFINLSAQDFPLKTQTCIHNFLSQNIGKDFMTVSKQHETRPETIHRIEDFVTETEDEVICEPIKRPFLEDATPYIGNQWMILSRKFCEFVTHSPEVTKFKDFYRNTLLPDEGFFQTVIMNTSYQPTIVNDDKRTIDWIHKGTNITLRPRDFTANDAEYLITSNNLFARKFDQTVDSEIFNILESHLAKLDAGWANQKNKYAC